MANISLWHWLIMSAPNSLMPLQTLSWHNRHESYSWMACPIPIWITKLIQLIKQWFHQHKVVLIGMDANENVDDPCSKIAGIFAKMDLIDMHHHWYPATPKLPTMHQRGSFPIDLMLGSLLLAAALNKAWILPFRIPPLIKGNHCLLGLDFDPDILFSGTVAQLSPSTPHGINSHCKMSRNIAKRQSINVINTHWMGWVPAWLTLSHSHRHWRTWRNWCAAY